MKNWRINIEKVYALSVALAMALLFFANADKQHYYDGSEVSLGIGKAFYVPCGIALLCSYFIKKRDKSIEYRLYWLIGIALFSSLLHPPVIQNILALTIVRFVLGILCFKNLKDINPIYLVKYVAIVSPLIIFPHYLLTNPFAFGDWRYGGFYGDANFLAFALNIVIALCYLAFKKTKDPVLKIVCVISIIGAVPLIMVGMSRGGILGLICVFIVILGDIWKRNKKVIAYLFLIAVLGSGVFIEKFADIIDSIEMRFSGERESDRNGANNRWIGVMSAANVLSNRPELIPFGIGLGNTVSHLDEYEKYGYAYTQVIHNTYVSILYEAGLFAFLLYLSLYVSVYKRLKKHKLYFLIGLFFSAFISFFTLPGYAFMPGWILLFFLCNKRLYEVAK